MKLGAYEVMDFSGGIRRDASPLQLKKNELVDARNVEIDEQGRIVVRRGSSQIGDTRSGNIENSFSFSRNSTAANSRITTFIINDDLATDANIFYLRTQRLTTSITAASTTIVVVDSTGFTASGNVEIEGDLIAYTGNAANTLTGVTGIRVSHAAGAAVNQWAEAAQPGVDIIGSSGVYYAVVNNVLIVNSIGTWKSCDNNDGESLSDLGAVSPTLFITNYRDRLYAAGNGNGSTTNGLPYAVSFSARGNGTSWTAADNFLVEDQRGEMITGCRVLNDRLIIFKNSSIFTFDETELKQRLLNVGAWNNKVPVEIDGIIYTFCPEGIFATNGFEAKNIGEPVREFWENFQPVFDANNRTVTNTFAGKLEDRYFLYIHDITRPETLNDVVLEYNTKTKVWTTHTGGFTDFRHFGSFNRFEMGDAVPSQYRPALFGGDSSGRYFRFFESRFVDGQSTPVKQGGDIFTDLISNSAGTPIPATFETPLYDLTHPDLYKKFNDLILFTEQGSWHVSYRVMNEKGISEYQPLGEAKYPYTKIPFPPSAQGWRIGFRFSTVDTNSTPIFNGFILENTEVIQR